MLIVTVALCCGLELMDLAGRAIEGAGLSGISQPPASPCVVGVRANILAELKLQLQIITKGSDSQPGRANE